MQTKTRKVRDTTLSHVDKDAPAYRVIYGVFGGLTPFVVKSNQAVAEGIATRTVPKSTAHLWLTTGLIPARRQADVVATAQRFRLKLDRSLFVPVPAND